MNRYKVRLTDRCAVRTVAAESAKEAVAKVVGKRLLIARENCYSEDRDGRAVWWQFDLAVRTGATKGGATPFRNIQGSVEAL